MWSAILGLLSGLPKLLGLIKSLFSAISNIYTQYQIDKRNKEMADAVLKAKQTKDTSDIDDLFSGRKK